MKTQKQVSEKFESNVLELVGADEQVDQYDYGKSVEIVIQPESSGEVLAVTLYSNKGPSGPQAPAGEVLVFDADPGILAGDTDLSIAQRRMLLGELAISAGDWLTDSSSGSATVTEVVYFGGTESVFVAWYHTDATALNDGAGDDETLEARLWWNKCEGVAR